MRFPQAGCRAVGLVSFLFSLLGLEDLLRGTTLLSAVCMLGWAALDGGTAPWLAPVLMSAAACCSSANSVAMLNIEYEQSPPQSKTLYLGETSALCSAANCAAVTAGAALQPALEALLGARSVSVLFLLSGILVSMNVWISGSWLPAEKRS